MSGGDFVDSNVVIYLYQQSDPRKHLIARDLLRNADPGSLTISFQVVNETLNALTQKFTPQMPVSEARVILDRTLRPLWRIDPSTELYSSALSVKARYQFSFYDSLIVAAALEADCERLLSEDLQHGQRIEGLTIVNPFIGA